MGIQVIEDSKESVAIPAIRVNQGSPVRPAIEGPRAPRVIEVNEVKEEIRGIGGRVGGVHQEI